MLLCQPETKRNRICTNQDLKTKSHSELSEAGSVPSFACTSFRIQKNTGPFASIHSMMEIFTFQDHLQGAQKYISALRLSTFFDTNANTFYDEPDTADRIRNGSIGEHA